LQGGHIVKQQSGSDIRFIDKVFLISIVVIFISCLVIIGTSVTGNTQPKKTNTASIPYWEYKTVSVEHEKECDFSEMLDDEWQLIGIQIKEYETNLKFRKDVN
jgi:hypothetical protein